MLFKMNKKTKIYPYDIDHVIFWTKKWGIKNNQLNEAIIATGSLEASVIKNYLIKNGVIVSVSGLLSNFKSGYNKLVAKWVDEDGF